jgi:hypothetical protein
MNYVETGYVRTGYTAQDSDTQGAFRFDGHGRLVFVSRTLPGLDVAEMYSRWKDWARVNETASDPNAKWAAAMRYSGGDPIPGGFTGATFFMQNGWRVIYDPNVTSIAGVLFSEDFDTALWSYDRTPIYPVTVSAVVNRVTTTQNIVTGDLSSVPSSVDIATEVRAALAVELARLDVRVGTRASQADVFAAG